MRSLWIAACVVLLAVGALVLVLGGGDDAGVEAPERPAGSGATAGPAGPERAPAAAPERGATVARSPQRHDPRPTLAVTGDGGLADARVRALDDELRAWARRKRADSADRLDQARAEIRVRVTERVAAEVDQAIDNLTREVAKARRAGDRGRIQALASRLADLRARRDTIIDERVEAIVAE